LIRRRQLGFEKDIQVRADSFKGDRPSCTRVSVLKDAFGQIFPSKRPTVPQLWKELRRGVGSAQDILRFLADHCTRSLLGDYACLRPTP
jgi:hypothetical protein